MTENCTIIAGHMNDLRNYYDENACLKCNHKENMIAIFRSDKLLSKSLDKDFAGLNSLESTRLPLSRSNRN